MRQKKETKTAPLPGRIKVGGCLYTVYTSKAPRLPDTGEAVWGACNSSRCEILLSSSLSRDRQKEVLLHELVHAILKGFYITLPSDELEEKIADIFSSGFLMILRDNPKLVKYLLEGLDEKH